MKSIAFLEACDDSPLFPQKPSALPDEGLPENLMVVIRDGALAAFLEQLSKLVDEIVLGQVSASLCFVLILYDLCRCSMLQGSCALASPQSAPLADARACLPDGNGH